MDNKPLTEPTLWIPVEQSPAKKLPAKNLPAKNLPAKNLPAKESPAKESPAKESPAKESPAKESPAKESSAKELSAKESPAKESPAKELAVKQIFKKIKPMTKQDKNHILKILENNPIDDDPTNDQKNSPENNWDSCNWIDQVRKIDTDILCRSLSQILNSELDSLPQKLIDQYPKLLEIQRTKKNQLTIMDVISNAPTMYRFAPSPSGYLHIGHMVPILLNILLMIVSKKCFNESKQESEDMPIVFRIDDTDPTGGDYSQAIKSTMRRIMGLKFNKMIQTRSSDNISRIVAMIGESIIKGEDKFYVDLTDQETIKEERASRTENIYRRMSPIEQKDLWKNVQLIESIRSINTIQLTYTEQYKSAVIRAKIDMNSNNGNLRDPVVLRFVNNNESLVLMPTYDLVCPVLDSLDSSDRGSAIMIALRDCNYYDRLEQYHWMQEALHLKPTAVVTFSRVNFENVLLSKRSIKKLIESRVVDSWDDYRLMTIDGISNRGMRFAGLLQFYWLTGRMSTGNRATSQDLATLFAINDSVLSKRSNFIIDRYPVDFKISDSDRKSNDYMVITIQGLISTYVSGSKSENVDVKHSNQLIVNDEDLEKVPKVIKLADIVVLKSRLISDNLIHINNLLKTNNLDRSDLDQGDELLKSHPGDRLKTCNDIRIGETIKINNFKDLPSEPIFGRYYLVVSKDRYLFQENEMDRINVISIS
jgi:hypothetical protein